MDQANISNEGPLPFWHRGFPSEPTNQQGSEKVEKQTSPEEVILLFYWSGFTSDVCYTLLTVLLIVYYCFCSIRGIYGKDMSMAQSSRFDKNGDTK